MSFFADFERDLVRAAAARARPARRSWLALLLASVAVVGVAGTAAAATYVALRNSSIAPFAASSFTPEQRVAAGSSVVTELRAADPDRGVPPWTLRVSTSDAGLQCSTVGQVVDGAFGLVGLDGVFRELPEANADACGEPNTLLGTRVFAARRTRDARTVVYGVAGPELESVAVRVAGGAWRKVPHTADGAFLYVLRRYPEDVAPEVELRRGGVTRTAFGSGSGDVVPDPDGGRAWKLSAWALGWNHADLPRLATACASFANARSVPDEPSVSSTPVCGLEPTRRGVEHDTLYFATRRLSGTGPSKDFMSGNWNHHPARVAVWGVARGHKRIVVRAGRFTRTVRLTYGGFLVFLPVTTDPRTVTVDVDGKRYGSTFGTVPPPKGLR